MTIKFKTNLSGPSEVEKRLTHHFKEIVGGRSGMGFEGTNEKSDKGAAVGQVTMGSSMMDEAIVKWGFWKQAQLAKVRA